MTQKYSNYTTQLLQKMLDNEWENSKGSEEIIQVAKAAEELGLQIKRPDRRINDPWMPQQVGGEEKSTDMKENGGFETPEMKDRWRHTAVGYLASGNSLWDLFEVLMDDVWVYQWYCSVWEGETIDQEFLEELNRYEKSGEDVEKAQMTHLWG